MNTRTYALIMGIVFLGLAATGLIPGLLHPPSGNHDLAVDAMHGDALGIFPVNILHTLVHAAFGVWGLAASRSWDAAKTFAKVTAVIYAVFVVMGLLPEPFSTTFGLVPLHGNDVWLHVAIAATAAYFGFMHRDDRGRERA